MATNFNALRDRLSKIGKKGGSFKDSFVKFEENIEYKVRIVGFQDNDGNPFKELQFYYFIEGKSFLAPSQFGKPDPAKELANALWKDVNETKNQVSWNLVKDMKPTTRMFLPIVVRGKEDEGVKLWAFSESIYDNIVSIILDPDYDDLCDHLLGHDIKIKLEKPDPKRKYATTKILGASPKQTKLGTAAQIKQWTESVPDLDSFYQQKSEDEIEKMISDWLATKGQGETKSDGEGTEHNKAALEAKEEPKENKAAKSTSHNNVNDAFADLENFEL